MIKFFRKQWVLVGIILILGGLCRFYNLNWDEGKQFHPDERNIDASISRISFFNKMNPEFFAYNGLWIYAGKVAGIIVSKVSDDNSWVSDWGKINLITRSMSALCSVLSIYLMFLIVQKAINKRAAIVASLLTVYTVGFIQYAHYGVTESVLVFWLLLLTWLSMKQAWFGAAIVAGMAVATKTTALSFLLIPLVSYIQMVLGIRKGKYKLRLIFNLIVLGLVFCLTVAMLTPYSFLSWNKFVESMNYESGVVSGKLQVPYTLQFWNTDVYWYQIVNLGWHIGPAVQVLGIFGSIWLIFHQVRGRGIKGIEPLLIFSVVYFIYVGSWYAKFMRYMILLYPMLIMSTVWLLEGIINRSKRFGLSVICIVVISSFVWSCFYMSIFAKESTRITASEWIYQNAAENSYILTEHWDDRVPVQMNVGIKYNFIEMRNYDQDGQEKLSEMSTDLARGDYLILSSKRLWATITRAANKYPMTSNYYDRLFAGDLGYEMVEKVSSYPSLGSWEINDDIAEETFQVYDHPTVMIFRNKDRLSIEEIRERIGSVK